MDIIINGRYAALKSGTSFDMVFDNRLFSGSDTYTLAITLPLKDCPENLAIFGNIDRNDIKITRVALPCIISDTRSQKIGVAAVTEISDTEVKIQFLEGRSVQNYDTTLDEVYINELELGCPASLSLSNNTPASVWAVDSSTNYVALPWCNGDNGYVNNLTEYANGTYSWAEDNEDKLSFQPFLLHVVEKILDAIGYTYDLSTWRNSSVLRYLLVCNTLPASWGLPDFSYALPHWSVPEFFEKLELFMGCYFDFDHSVKTVTMWTPEYEASPEKTHLDNVVDSHTVTITHRNGSESSRCDFIGSRNIGYKTMEHNMAKFYDCDWYIRANKSKVINKDTIAEVLNAFPRVIDTRGDNPVFNSGLGNVRPSYGSMSADKKLYYCPIFAEDCARYLAPYVYMHEMYERDTPLRKTYECKFTQRVITLNAFGPRISDEENTDDIDEVEFVPVCVDFTEESLGLCMFLSPGEFGNSNVGGQRPGRSKEEHEEYYANWQNSVAAGIANGEVSQSDEFYDTIFVGFWNGALPKAGKLPFPYLDYVTLFPDNTNKVTNFSLSLVDGMNLLMYEAPKINPAQKFKFSWLADTVPNPRAIFYIEGKRYVCEKITATFTERGMSQLLKGEFYRIDEN